MFALPGASPLALPSAVVWHQRNRMEFCALGQKWDGAGAQQFPFNAKTTENGFLSVCPCGVVGMWSHMEHMQCVQGGILLLPAIPCTSWASLMEPAKMSLIHGDISVLTSRPLNYSLPSAYVIQGKPGECFPLCSCPLCWPFPLRHNAHRVFSLQKLD